ncbi:hypothetical protein INT46_000135 [Mucor plumbeus]|uniref:Uncharacterized protein n=1 Tax=Mucor plumbeus TaxID=97098 RepID=A0A8H7QJG8_9FUNG|nr:hypothetical protein INT46_000135 [Mucor plumbeus]
MHNAAIFEEEETEDDDNELEEEIFMDDSSSSYSGTMAAAVAQNSSNETMLLAQFLSSTGPEEYAKQDTKTHQQFKKASRLLSRLRKRPTMPVLRPTVTTNTPNNNVTVAPIQTEKKMNYIPLPVYNYQHVDLPPSSHHHSQKKESLKKINSATTTANNATIANNINKSTRQQQQQQQQQKVNALRDSGIYSETNSEKDAPVISTSTAYGPLPPLPPFTSVMNELQFPHPPFAFKLTSPNNYQQSQQHHNNPHRPAPLPPALASATIATATSVYSSDGDTSIGTSTHIRSVPEAALKRRSVRLRHVQVQTNNNDSIEQEEVEDTEHNQKQMPSRPNAADRQACPHCRQSITLSSSRLRRPSCPPALSSGPKLVSLKNTDDAKVLLAMIMKLKSQLEEEKQCRLKLEKAIHQRQSDDRREQLAKEKDRWAGDCLWLNDRIALLPE